MNETKRTKRSGMGIRFRSQRLKGLEYGFIHDSRVNLKDLKDLKGVNELEQAFENMSEYRVHSDKPQSYYGSMIILDEMKEE